LGRRTQLRVKCTITYAELKDVYMIVHIDVRVRNMAGN